MLPVAEGRIVCAKADSVVMMVRWRKTPERAARMAARILHSLGVDIDGVVLTRMNQSAQFRSGHGDPGSYYSQFKAYHSP